MKALVDVELKPFEVPSIVFAIEKRPGQIPPAFSLREVDREALARMCDEFKASVLEEAGFHQA